MFSYIIREGGLNHVAIKRFIYAVVLVTYIGTVHDVVSLPLFAEKDDSSHGNINGISNSVEYDGVGSLWGRGDGKSIYIDLHSA